MRVVHSWLSELVPGLPDAMTCGDALTRASLKLETVERAGESLEGAGNPARFTPMNDDVRSEFRAQSGWDPIDIWHGRTDAASLRQFLDYRANLARHMQEDWLGAVESLRQIRPDLFRPDQEHVAGAGLNDAVAETVRGEYVGDRLGCRRLVELNFPKCTSGEVNPQL